MFSVGDEVVCVPTMQGSPPETVAILKAAGYALPRSGAHYTVRGIYAYDRWHGLYLGEIVNPPILTIAGVRECAFDVRNFRKIKPDAIAIFRAMCVSPKPLVPVE